MQETIRFALNISFEAYKAYYKGRAQSIRVRANDGRVIQLPANLFQQYLTKEGINGSFILKHQNGKLIDLSRL